ncbi:MAG: TlpA disulfide reductase family protein, partial [Chloroflexota bacterium]
VLVVLAACGAQPAAMPTADPFATSTPLPLIEDEEPVYAPDFTLASLSGERVSLSDYAGGWVLLNFWQTTCAPCVEEMPVFQQLHDERDDLTVLAVNIREQEPQIRPFLAEHRLTFPVLLSDDTVALSYTVMALPQTVVIDPNGEIQYRQFGAVKLESFEVRLNGLMQGV